MGEGMIYDADSSLKHYEPDIQRRLRNLDQKLKALESDEKIESIANLVSSYKKFGVHQQEKNFTCHEWIPNIAELHLVGDFNDWVCLPEHRYVNQGNDHWHLEFSSSKLVSGSKLKLAVRTEDGRLIYRISPWARYVTHSGKKPLSEPYDWEYFQSEYNSKSENRFVKPGEGLKIYESHVGICTSKEKVSTYDDFRTQVLPRIKDLGYNCIQLMAIMEHVYYTKNF